MVEPDERMLGLISKRHPGVRTHETGVTDLPLGDASVDAVVVADAWHWFPKAGAGTEIARVLRPHGWLGCVWNDPLPQHEWEWQALRLDPALQRPSDMDPLDRLGLKAGRAEQRRFRWTWTLTPQQWRGFVSTVSHVRLLPDGERDAALDETSAWLPGRARRPGRQLCRSVTTHCACAGTQSLRRPGRAARSRPDLRAVVTVEADVSEGCLRKCPWPERSYGSDTAAAATTSC